MMVKSKESMPQGDGWNDEKSTVIKTKHTCRVGGGGLLLMVVK